MNTLACEKSLNNFFGQFSVNIMFLSVYTVQCTLL